jgi:hypothetical protein
MIILVIIILSIILVEHNLNKNVLMGYALYIKKAVAQEMQLVELEPPVEEVRIQTNYVRWLRYFIIRLKTLGK